MDITVTTKKRLFGTQICLFVVNLCLKRVPKLIVKLHENDIFWNKYQNMCVLSLT